MMASLRATIRGSSGSSTIVYLALPCSLVTLRFHFSFLKFKNSFNQFEFQLFECERFLIVAPTNENEGGAQWWVCKAPTREDELRHHGLCQDCNWWALMTNTYWAVIDKRSQSIYPFKNWLIYLPFQELTWWYNDYFWRAGCSSAAQKSRDNCS